jgi:hypothetical protein
MIIDVSIEYDGGHITARSAAARYLETRPAIIGLSKERYGVMEVIECVGQALTPELERAFWERDKGSRAYRFINPFLEYSFEPDPAFAIIRHFCYLAHSNLKPGRSVLREMFRLDRYSLAIKLPQYSSIPGDKRKMFEKNLRGRFGRFRIVS